MREQGWRGRRPSCCCSSSPRGPPAGLREDRPEEAADQGSDWGGQLQGGCKPLCGGDCQPPPR
eukprot:3311522-Pyramimonas_sp.AAC.1